MESIERRLPKLINCFGRINFDSKQCENCRFAFECYTFEPTLRQDDFIPGKYREGFGRLKRNVKRK